MTAIANLPDLRPSLLLDFANSGRVDPRIQCTRASSATCFGPDGKLRTVAAGVPRIDYDPGTGKCLGLLVEEGRTNLWTNSAVAEAKTFAVTAQAYTLSFEGDGSVAFTGAYGGNSSAGTVQSGRRVLTFTPSAGSLICTPSGNVRNVQFEAGAFPTSYIPTEASAVTRAADLVVMKDLAWLSELRGTFFIETLEQRAAASSGYFGIGSNSKSFEQRTSLYVSSSSSGIYSLSFCKEGVTQYSANVTTAAARRKLALGYEKDNARAALNGTLMVSDSSFDPPSGYDTFGIGSVAGGWSGSTSPFLNGHVARFAFYPGRITDTQLQRLTA